MINNQKIECRICGRDVRFIGGFGYSRTGAKPLCNDCIGSPEHERELNEYKKNQQRDN